MLAQPLVLQALEVLSQLPVAMAAMPTLVPVEHYLAVR
jgi:hypothetical protein